MCGIAGIFSARDRARDAILMTQFLAHRGPDDSGISRLLGARSGHCGTFGNRRLGILDLSSAGHQPMSQADESGCITYNGEIYNYRELRDELARSGTSFRSHSDTEVVLAGWQHRGSGFLPALRGMFAFALWDSRAERGYLVRDRFGIKPLYVAQVDGDVLFASEMRALLATGRLARKFSPNAVRSYLATGSVSEPDTIIEGVFMAPPGCILEVLRKGDRFTLSEPRRFATAVPVATLDAHDDPPDASRIRHALSDSVRHHLVSDVPVAIFLSGGIDSSAIAGLASEVTDEKLQSFTLVFPETERDESARARATALRFGMSHHELPFSSQDVGSAVSAFFEAMDQPTADGFNTFIVSRAVRAQGMKVALSGVGGDEFFGGYPSFHRARAASWLWKLPRAVRTGAASALSAFGDARAQRVSAMLRASTAAEGAYDASRTLFTPRQIRSLLSPDFLGGNIHPVTRIDPLDSHVMQQVSTLEATQYMLNTLLRDADVFSMAQGLEIRVPFVDEKVVAVAHAAANGIPRNSHKPVLVDALRDLLPQGIEARPKAGFTLPFERWLKTVLRDEVGRVIREDSATGVRLAANSVARVWGDFLAGRADTTWSRPWALYTLVRWASQNEVETES